MNIKAKVQLQESFNITGRGLVFVVEIIEGDFWIGDHLHFMLNNNAYQLKIKGVEFFPRHPNPKLRGVLVEINEIEFQELYKNPLLKEIIAEII